ncbi:endolytic transglycosylase MltG [Planobispora rosea]|nr:endolytic transglycosylase MltG [Planobispora rosea]
MDFLVGADSDDGRSPRGSRAGRGRRRKRRRNKGGFLAPLLAVIILVGGLGGGGYYGYTWLRDAMTVEDYTGQGTGKVLVEIKQGQSSAAIGQTLEEQGVVKSARAFTDAAEAAGKSASFQPGVYELRKQMSGAAAVELLDPSKQMVDRVTLKEGLRLSDTLVTLAKATGKPLKEFQQAAKDAEALGLPSYAKGRLEGYAFPATYDITPKMSAADILTAMVDRFNQTAEKERLVAGAKEMGRTPHEIMTIASIVQAEAGNVDDMGKIARVIYNRLKVDQKLEMDSTIFYALNKYGIAASNADIESDSPYNTYRRLGLPPGPIANPGDHAIQAALNPTEGDWRWFVTTDPERGITKFVSTEDDFLKIKAEFERNQGQQRQGNG